VHRVFCCMLLFLLQKSRHLGRQQLESFPGRAGDLRRSSSASVSALLRRLAVRRIRNGQPVAVLGLVQRLVGARNPLLDVFRRIKLG